MPETPLLHYLRLQRGLDRDVLSALRVSAASVESELRRLEGRVGVGAAVRSHQLVQSQAYINREMARFWGQAGNTIAEHQANAAAEAAEASLRSNPTLSRLFSQADLDYMSRSTRASAAQGLETAMQRVSGASYVPLAESVYNNAALTSGKVDDIVTAALARGASAAELAKDVRGFINPNTPGGVRYASMRLGRTELNNAFHASQIQQAQKSPWVTAVMWNLSGSHPKPDECNEYADDTHFTGGEAGQFKPTEVPSKPHPNCLCYTTTVDVGRDEFIKQFESGQYNQFLEETGLPPNVIEPARAKAAAATAPELPKAFSRFSQTEPMDLETAVKGANPGFKTSTEYGINCQKTVMAVEMRRRGWNVVAKPGGGGYGSTAAHWKGPNGRAPSWRKAWTDEEFKKRIEPDPVGSRYNVEIMWSWDKVPGGGMHIFSAEKMPDGSVQFLDGQIGKTNLTERYWRMRDHQAELKFFRVDNAVPKSASYLEKQK